GTTNSLVAYVKDGVPVVVRDRSGDALVPSIVSAAEDGTFYVGREEQRRQPYRVFREAVHGQGDRRCAGRPATVPVPHHRRSVIARRRARRNRPDRTERSRAHAARDFVADPARAEASC